MNTLTDMAIANLSRLKIDKRGNNIQLAVYPWGDCNMRCLYCFYRGKRGVLSVRNFISALNLLKSKEPGFSKITFLGGEPTLRPELLKSYLDAAVRNVPDCQLFLFTNGLEVKESVIRMLQKFMVNVILSIDGFESINTCQRSRVNNKKYSPLKIVKKFLAANFYSLSFSLTVTPENVPYLLSNLKKLFDSGASSIGYNVDYSASWSNSNLRELKKQIEAERLLYLKLIKSGKPYKISNCYELLQEIVKGEKTSCSTFSLFPDGRIYACDKMLAASKAKRNLAVLSDDSFEKDRESFFNLARRAGYQDRGLICRAGLYFYHKFVKCLKGRDLEKSLRISNRVADLVEKEKMKSLRIFMNYSLFRKMHGL